MGDNIFSVILKFIGSLFAGEAKVEVSIPLDPEKAVQPEMKPEPVAPKSFVLTRTKFSPEGIFGELKDNSGTFVAYILEHSYDNKPKVADGVYTCVRGSHRLHGMTEDFSTFEVMGVPDFDGKSVKGILFHWGNYDRDSEGCLLMGSTETPTMIGNSRDTWGKFMNSLAGVNSFQLKVVSS